MSSNQRQPLNVALLRETLAHIEADPGSWQQRNWYTPPQRGTDCGSAMCFAGWAAVLDEPAVIQTADPHEWLIGDVTIATHARTRLGLGLQQGTILFDGDNTLPMLQRIVGALIDSGGAATPMELADAAGDAYTGPYSTHVRGVCRCLPGDCPDR